MLQQLFQLEGQVPAWLRPSYRGALFIPGIASSLAGKLFAAAILASLALMLGFAAGLSLFAMLLVVSMVAGAAAGTIHGILQPAETWGRPGTWLRWSAAIFGFVAMTTLLTPHGPFSLQDGGFNAMAAGFSVLAGGGLMLLDDRRIGRPTARSFQLLQSRQRLWATARQMRTRMQTQLAEEAAATRADPLHVLR